MSGHPDDVGSNQWSLDCELEQIAHAHWLDVQRSFECVAPREDPPLGPAISAESGAFPRGWAVRDQQRGSRRWRDDEGEEEQRGAKTAQREDVDHAAADRKQAGLTRRQDQPECRGKKDEEGKQDRTAAEVVQRDDEERCHDPEEDQSYRPLARQRQRAPGSLRVPRRLRSRVGSRRFTHRASIGVHFWSRSPMYSLSGLISRLSRCCSITWAVQPDMRDIAKTGVKRSVGIPK